MNAREAKRAALVFVANVARAQGSDEAVASFLGLPQWVGSERHKDVDKVCEAVDEVLAELKRRGTRRERP